MAQTDINSILALLMQQEVSPEMLEIKKMILRRIATETDIKPSRIPAPLNITEIGGYFNLMNKINQQEMLRQTLASILGIPVQTPPE